MEQCYFDETSESNEFGDGAFIDAPILIGLTTPAQADGVLLNLSTRQPKAC